MNKENRFYCFDRAQQSILRARKFGQRLGMIVRITNRSWTNWTPTMKGQLKTKRRAMTEAEAQAVYNTTGFECFLEEKYV